jgi:hypothetical protein
VLQAVQPLLFGLRVLDIAALPGDEQLLGAWTAAAGHDEAASSSSSSQQVKWSHLLHLQQSSQEWAAAVAAFSEKWPAWWSEDVQDSYAQFVDGAAVVIPAIKQQFADAIELCRTLVAAAPLPVVYNNPSCGSFAGVSEAAASCKACAGCSCRYCSVACQKADWKRHKGACKRMAAAGQTCV